MAEKILFETQLTDIRSTDVETIGTFRWVGNNVYKWVHNGEASTALPKGTLCCHEIALAETTTPQTVLKPATADLMLLAGVVMAATSLTADFYGWIQVLGYNVSVSVTNTTDAAIVAGDYLLGVDSNFFGTLDASTQPAYIRNIQILEAFATAQTPAAAWKKGYVNCLK